MIREAYSLEKEIKRLEAEQPQRRAERRFEMRRERRLDPEDLGRIEELSENVMKGERGLPPVKKLETALGQQPPGFLEKLAIGTAGLGYTTESWKANFFVRLLERSQEKLAKGEALAESAATIRFLAGLRKQYREDADRAEKGLQDLEEGGGRLTKTSGALRLAANFIRWGRTAADVVGWTAAAPLRYAMLGSMWFSRGADAAKEARFMNREVIEKTRLTDIREAAGEAWQVYGEAREKASGAKPTVKELERAYTQSLPATLQERLARGAPGMASGILQEWLKKYMESRTDRIQAKIRSIETDPSLAAAQRQAKLERLFGKYSKELHDFDRMLGRTNEVDLLAAAALVATKAGKAALYGMTAHSLAVLAERFFFSAETAEAAELPQEGKGKTPETGGGRTGTAAERTPTARDTTTAQTNVEQIPYHRGREPLIEALEKELGKGGQWFGKGPDEKKLWEATVNLAKTYFRDPKDQERQAKLFVEWLGGIDGKPKLSPKDFERLMSQKEFDIEAFHHQLGRFEEMSSKDPEVLLKTLKQNIWHPTFIKANTPTGEMVVNLRRTKDGFEIDQDGDGLADQILRGKKALENLKPLLAPKEAAPMGPTPLETAPGGPKPGPAEQPPPGRPTPEQPPKPATVEVKPPPPPPEELWGAALKEAKALGNNFSEATLEGRKVVIDQKEKLILWLNPKRFRVEGIYQQEYINGRPLTDPNPYVRHVRALGPQTQEAFQKVYGEEFLKLLRKKQ